MAHSGCRREGEQQQSECWVPAKQPSGSQFLEEARTSTCHIPMSFPSSDYRCLTSVEREMICMWKNQQGQEQVLRALCLGNQRVKLFAFGPDNSQPSNSREFDPVVVKCFQITTCNPALTERHSINKRWPERQA
ncbi:uncharacterized protein LOC128931597 [Callithrix jacchus]